MPESVLSETSDCLRIYLLGEFRVVVASHAIVEQAWRLRKAKSLLKLLALAPAHKLHRDQILEWLWPDLDPEAATNNLHRTLHTVRNILQPQRASQRSPFLSLQGDILSLSLTLPIWTDVEAFEVACASASQTRQVVDYEAALALYTGELLSEDRYEDWTISRRDQIQRHYLTLLTELARRQIDGQNYDSAIQMLQRLVTADPVREETHVTLMRVYALIGQSYQALRQYQQLRSVLRRELEVEPIESTQRLYQDIRAGRYPSRQQRLAYTAPAPSIQSQRSRTQAADTIAPPQEGMPRTNLPHSLTGFVGREQEIARVHRLLTTTRLLTLIGAGGCGKTRLAIQSAATLVDSYVDGIFLISLGALTDPSLVPQTVAGTLALDLREMPQVTSTIALQRLLRSKQMLLLFDNCEHLVEVCANLAAALLQTCPHLRILATSRQALGLIGETAWRVPSLSVPDPEHLPPFERLLEFDAVRLFLERASASKPGFALTFANTPAAIEICHRLEGIPLALELAAVRVKVLSVEQIAARLDNALTLLVGGNRSALPRQQTLRATMDWSYTLLGETEQALFRRLSVFVGGWTIEGAEEICAGDGIEVGEVLDVLTQLVDKSLVVTEERGDHTRYRLLETLRQYSSEKLVASGEATRVRKRHAARYLAQADKLKARWEGTGQAQLIAQVEEEHDNLRAILRWALESNEGEVGLRLGGMLWRFWQVRGYLTEGRVWLEDLLAKSPDVSAVVRASALQGAGVLAMDQGDYRRAKELYEEGLAFYRLGNDTNGVMVILNNLGIVVEASGDYMRAIDLYEESVALARQQGNRDVLARALNNLGVAVYRQGDYARAIALYEESLALVRASGNEANLVVALNNVAEVACRKGDYAQGAIRYREGLPLAQSLGYKTAIAFYLGGLAEVAAGLGQLKRATRLRGAEELLREAIGAPLEPDDQPRYNQLIAGVRTRLDAEEYVHLWAEGRALSLERAIMYALADDEPAEPLAPKVETLRPETLLTMDMLSQRERQIVLLIAAGRTNREIAGELAISQRTVDTHISNILSKLGFASRAQVMAWVAEQHLVTLPGERD